MKCAACNAENPANAKFCQACGVPLAMQQAPAQQAPTPQPGAEPKSAGLQITPTAIGIALLLFVSVVGAAYVGWTWYEDSARPSATSQADEKAIDEKRRKAEQDRLADERQQAAEVEREKQRQQADAQEAMKLAQAKAGEDQRRAADAAREAEEKAKRAETKAREDAAKAEQDAKAREAKAAQEARAREAKAQQDAKAAQEAKAREAKAKEDARAKELARQREAAAREAKAKQATTTAQSVQAPAPAPAPVQPAPAPVQVAQAPVVAAPAQNEPCAGLTGLKREQCTSCNRHTVAFRKSACEDRAMDRYCEGKWNQPGQPECVDSRRR